MSTSMNWFRGEPGHAAQNGAVQVQSIDRDTLFGPQDYDADPALRDAVNTALLLDQPLLLTGEPGTGKTQLAEKLALELGFPLFKFETKSSSTGQDLYYTFDHVARFQAAQVSRDADALQALRFVDYGAMGRAVLQSLKRADAAGFFTDGKLPNWYSGPGRAVVLVDEIDKAPSDFPNDLLNEVEHHYFRIRELNGGQEVHADPGLRPVVVITSNSEKQLPDAFLRRCIFHHLAPVTRSRMLAITLRRLARLQVRAGPMLDSALDLFEQLRSSSLDLRKRPSTSEFLAYIAALLADPDLRHDLAVPPAAALRVLATLVKSPEDQHLVRQHLESQAQSGQRSGR